MVGDGVIPSGWDTTDKTGDGDWTSRAWDSISGVSWFYKMWYRYGYSESSSTCSRKPWLSQVETADLINAYQVWVANNRSDSRIVPVFDACHSSGNPYTHSELRNLAAKPVTSVSDVIVSNSNGSTRTVTFTTNAGILLSREMILKQYITFVLQDTLEYLKVGLFISTYIRSKYSVNLYIIMLFFQ